MYIFQRTYKNCESIADGESNSRKLVVILPSAPQAEMQRFVQIISQCIHKINAKATGAKWQVVALSSKDGARTPLHNYDAVYQADLVIAECTDKKPNVFYLVGLAHALGRSVCSCYRLVGSGDVDIPFNVQGRQSMTYSLSTIPQQIELENRLIEWIKNYD